MFCFDCKELGLLSCCYEVMEQAAIALRRVIFGCSGPVLTGPERELFAKAQPFGFILFARNIETPDQTADLVKDLRAAVGWHAPVLIDQEGGRVQRMGPPHWTQFNPPLDDAAHDQAERLFWLRGRLIADELLAVGIDVNCAPCCDVPTAQTHPFLLNRCFGTDAQAVKRNAQAHIDGLRAGGVAPIIKHLPGHGRAVTDSHLALPTVNASAQDLRASDFKPFQGLRDVTMGMTGHVVLPAFDPDHPATQSPVLLSMIRNEIGFSGLLMTDDLSMEALDGDIVQRATASLAAGCDVALHCNGDFAEMTALTDAIDVFDGPAASRASLALKDRPSAVDVDIAALRAEFQAHTGD